MTFAGYNAGRGRVKPMGGAGNGRSAAIQWWICGELGPNRNGSPRRGNYVQRVNGEFARFTGRTLRRQHRDGRAQYLHRATRSRPSPEPVLNENSVRKRLTDRDLLDGRGPSPTSSPLGLSGCELWQFTQAAPIITGAIRRTRSLETDHDTSVNFMSEWPFHLLHPSRAAREAPPFQRL